MTVKESGHPKSIVTKFDLLGTDEEALSKAFAYTIANEPDALFKFLQSIGLSYKNTLANFKDISIVTENHRDEGRTDIEIKLQNKFHVIIESKVRKNKVRQQRTQYLKSFDKKTKDKVLCFLTQERDLNKQISNDVEIVNLSWLEITDLFDTKTFSSKPTIKEFLRYSIKNYKMKEQKEILIQDLSDKTELKRFKDFNVYRRDETFGSPLYFAPYFTRKANQDGGEGISYLAKILGILTLNAKDIGAFEADLRRFKDDNKTVDKWKEGVMLGHKDQVFTYYFLDTPLKLTKNLQKDPGRKKGRGKDWVAAMIPKNRCVTFQEFTKRLMD
jgi:uncharacterized protein (DUF2132 family)